MQALLQYDEKAQDNDCARLLVHSWRLTMAHGTGCSLIESRFRCSCGATAHRVFRAFCVFLCVLALSQRRCLRVNPPGQAALTADEARLLALIAAAQNDYPATLDAHLGWLAEPPLRQTLENSVRELAGLLKDAGQRLPVPR